ncbi:MAG TPA: hypothetical protein VGZ22_30550 [Isosphaeraceae bacterium]|jgi:hypothetical protein|nr:hypothetical protein [Isosphaeraceae bacterium]
MPDLDPGSELAIEHHFSILIYPFRHQVSDQERTGLGGAFEPFLSATSAASAGRSQRLHALSHCWQTWWARLTVRERESAENDSYFFLPYVRDLIFPELCAESSPGQDTVARPPFSQSEQLAQLTSATLASLPADAVLRLTYRPDQLESFRHLRLDFERKGFDGAVIEQFSEPFQLCWVDAVLFPQQVGFLILKVQLSAESPPVARQRDFLHYIRLVQPPTKSWTLASWRGTASASFAFSSRDFVDFLVQGLAGPSEHVEPHLGRYLQQLTQTESSTRYSDTSDGQTYGQTFKTYTYGLVQQRSTTADSTQPVDPPVVAPHLGGDGTPHDDLLDSPIRRAIYELATCLDSRAPTYIPDPSYVKELWDHGAFSRWENWRGMALHDNIVFLGTRKSGFTQYGLPHNVESDYLHVYLLVLFQKTRLSMMFGDLMMRDSNLHGNLKKARHLWESFLNFQDHYWFNEVTLRPQGNDLYRHFQRALDVTALHRQMSSQVRELQDYYERKVERMLGRMVRIITFVGLPTSCVLSLFGKHFVPATLTRQGAILGTILIYAVFIIAAYSWTYARAE